MFTKYCDGDYMEDNKMGEVCRRHRRDEYTYETLVGKPEGKRSLGRCWC